MSFIQERFEQFAAIPFVDHPFADAKAPRAWAAYIGIKQAELAEFGITLADLPEQVQSRAEVRAKCRDTECHVLIGYICAMAWGNQGPGKSLRYAQAAWKARTKVSSLLEKLRNDGLPRRDAFELFCNEGEVKGLGVSYFTKLIFFFMSQTDCYIMDQWTSKSINYLTARRVVRIYNDAPTRANDGSNYDEYCALVDRLGRMLVERQQEGCGEKVEQRLFCKGGKEHESGEWRKIIRAVGNNFQTSKR